MNATRMADALRACLPHVDAARRASGGDGDIAAMNARAALAAYDADPQPSAGLVYLQQCEAKRDAATNDKDRTFWSRQAGAVRASLARL